MAFTFTYGYEPSGLTVALFLWRMVRALGWQTFRGMGQAMSEKHGGDGQRLELMLLGTRNGYQGQGLGRTMLRYLFDFARERGYASVVLETSKQTPAFEFYRHEGFVLEKEIPLPTISLCMMRRPSEGV
ncbi:MAG: GNAT family N-acetyltransferase [Cyanobacteria bacterium P01_E01_bin.42]